jgi:beta-lactamase class A
MTQTTRGTLESEVGRALAAAGADACLHARDIDRGAEVGLGSDEPVVVASVFKIGVLLELTRQAAEGGLSLEERIRVERADRVMGPTGLSGMLDDVELSLRDLAYLMMTISDNTATDVIMRKVGLDRINETLRSLGLNETVLTGDCNLLLTSLLEDLGFDTAEAASTLASTLADIEPDKIVSARTLRAETTTRSTPRETVRLLELIWKNEAGPPEACAEVRRIMSLQVWRDRLSSGFPDEVRISGKTGTLPGIRNEAGVVEYPDGGRYAVAVFTRGHTFAWRQPAIDGVIGTVARLAVDRLRSS